MRPHRDILGTGVCKPDPAAGASRAAHRGSEAKPAAVIGCYPAVSRIRDPSRHRLDDLGRTGSADKGGLSSCTLMPASRSPASRVI
jgi:hypothetical protein